MVLREQINGFQIPFYQNVSVIFNHRKVYILELIPDKFV